jgi:hypothetical protein
VALASSNLASALESNWLVAEGGEYPGSPSESGDRFAGAVSGWFGSATAAGFPCSTATARRSQLAAGAAGAFQAGQAPLAGAQLALALVAYMTAQVFGAGVASPPTASAAAQSAFTAAFADLDASLSSRASQIAAGTYTLAISTIVVFPPVISPPQPVL